MLAERETGAELTTAAAAALAGVSDRTIRNWIKDGRLPAHLIDEGRRVYKNDVLAVVQERVQSVAGALAVETTSYAPAEIVAEETAPVAEAVTATVAAESAAETTPEQVPNGYESSQVLTPELINVVLQPLVSQLEQSERERRRLHDENLELAGRLGYFQAELSKYKERVLLLETPKVVDVVEEVAEVMTVITTEVVEEPAEAPRKRWWRRLFSSD